MNRDFLFLLIDLCFSASKGLFRKPDWDLAASYYDRAGMKDIQRDECFV